MNTKKKILRNKEKSVQNIRFTVQALFALLCVWIGIEFYLFINYLETGGAAKFFERPPGVDGFLPISSMMSFYLFISTGELHSAHPAGIFIFFAVIMVSLLFGKSFCSWLCPVGFLSELIGEFGEKILKKRITPPKWLDISLRSLKYLMLGFLFYSVFYLMTNIAIKAFLDSPYNLISDIKMYYFFAEISQLALIITGALFVLSILIRNFWCRYLCPYGALLGLMNFLTPTKIKRNPVSCIDCNLCTKACPNRIDVNKVKTVWSDECTSCVMCVDACPVADTLQFESVIPLKGKRKINKKYIAVTVVAVFMLITGTGILTGNWQNDITKDEYLIHYKNKNVYGHPTGTEAVKRFNEEAAKELNEKPLQNKINK